MFFVTSFIGQSDSFRNDWVQLLQRTVDWTYSNILVNILGTVDVTEIFSIYIYTGCAKKNNIYPLFLLSSKAASKNDVHGLQNHVCVTVQGRDSRP